MKKKALLVSAIAAATTMAFSATAAAEGPTPDDVQVHPGHWGYVQTEGNGGGVPAAHFHNDDCFPGCYPAGPGGWGGFVSETVKGSGSPHR